MWIIICFDRINNIESNHSIVGSEQDLIHFINYALKTYTNAKTVMIPKSSDRIHRKMFPLVTSEKCDFYAQWMLPSSPSGV